MQSLFIPKDSKVTVVMGRSQEKKMFCWYGMNDSTIFEVGTISAYTLEEAKQILINNKRKGGVFSVKEINKNEEFSTLGKYDKFLR